MVTRNRPAPRSTSCVNGCIRRSARGPLAEGSQRGLRGGMVSSIFRICRPFHRGSACSSDIAPTQRISRPSGRHAVLVSPTSTVLPPGGGILLGGCVWSTREQVRNLQAPPRAHIERHRDIPRHQQRDDTAFHLSWPGGWYEARVCAKAEGRIHHHHHRRYVMSLDLD